MIKGHFIRWAIRHKPTGGFMPASSRKRHGYTNDEPVQMEDSHWCPRLFGRKQDAKTALTWWLKGITSVTSYGGKTWDDEGDESWHTAMPELEPDWGQVERKAEDFEIVFFHMHYTGA